MILQNFILFSAFYKGMVPYFSSFYISDTWQNWGSSKSTSSKVPKTDPNFEELYFCSQITTEFIVNFLRKKQLLQNFDQGLFLMKEMIYGFHVSDISYYGGVTLDFSN